MDRSRLEETLTLFQAHARGYMVRNAVVRAREDFEDIVREIDGGLSHVEWSKTLIPTPHFTDTESLLLRPSRSTNKPSHPGPDACASFPSLPPQSTATAAATTGAGEEIGGHDVLLEKIEAERDDSHTTESPPKDCTPSSCIGQDGEGQKESTVGDRGGGVVESTGDSTTVWSSLELDQDHSQLHKSDRQYCLTQEVPHTPEALRLHRNTLTMELIWLQQAIGSRKKYLSLKDRLSVS